MGHDLDIVDCDAKRIAEGNLYELESIDSSYISFNFSDYSHIWHIRHSHGHTCATVAKQLTDALAECKRNGWRTKIPDDMDGWSTNEHVFTYHMQRLLTFVSQPGYGNYRIISDQVWDVTPTDYSDYSDYSDSDEGDEGDEGDEEKDHEPEIFTYYRHPINGNMKIDTFAKAAEIALIEKIKGNIVRSLAWEELAKQMKGAPSM